MKSKLAVSLAAILAVSGCVQAPIGPTVAVMPGPNKPFEAFQQDTAVCRQFSEQQIGGSQAAQQTGTNQALAGAGIGALGGAAVGALLGAASGNAGAGAAIGAGVGGLGGAAVGGGQAQGTEMNAQRRYNIAYEQCMYSRGNQVPGYIQPSVAPAYASPSSVPPPPPGYAPPPPPPGYYPPR